MREPLPAPERCPVTVATPDASKLADQLGHLQDDWREWHTRVVQSLTDAVDIRHLNGQDSYGYDRDMRNSGALEVAPGCGVLVYAQGAQILNISLGYSDMGTRMPWTPDTISSVRSVSKEITAAALFDMQNRGYIDFAHKADDYVDYSHWPTGAKPGLGAQKIADLMSHRANSGGPMWVKAARSWAANMGMLDCKNDFYNYAIDLIDKWGPGSGCEPPHPGSGGDYAGLCADGECVYDDCNYFFLAQIMEAALAGANPLTAAAVRNGGDLGESYEGYVRKYVLDPLGMTQTFHSATGAPQIINKMADKGRSQLPGSGFRTFYGNPLNVHVAAPHFCVGGHDQPHTFKIYRGFLDNTPDRVMGSGNWFSTLNDMSRFFLGLKDLIGPEQHKLMHTKVGPNRGSRVAVGSFNTKWYGYGAGLNDLPADSAYPVPGETYLIATGVYLGYACIIHQSLETGITLVYHGIRNSLNDVDARNPGVIGSTQKPPGAVLMPIFDEAVRKFGVV